MRRKHFWGVVALALALVEHANVHSKDNTRMVFHREGTPMLLTKHVWQEA